ncbi:MAG: S26 family signal peptidase [Methanomicrobiales archaeon]|nr:S26 family signal peptidase [Methanomicrobiales archaeon]
MDAVRIRDAISRFRTSTHPAISLLRDLLWVFLVVGGIALSLFLVSGTWPAVVTVESESMVPHMNVGDLVLVVDKDRFGPLISAEEGRESGFLSFGDYGNVIIYQPNGMASIHPIIHRALFWVETGEVVPVTIQVDSYFFERNITAPHEGYITKGDHNANIDQVGAIQGIGQIEPVQRDWIVGKALLAIPFLGYPALYLPQFAAVIIIILILHELYLSSREKKEEGKAEKSPRKKGRR